MRTTTVSTVAAHRTGVLIFRHLIPSVYPPPQHTEPTPRVPLVGASQTSVLLTIPRKRKATAEAAERSGGGDGAGS
jgi:hypothetical protein